MSRRAGFVTAGLVVLFLAAHLPFVPKSLEDLDSINFALGLRHFDVARHQPHPPGYPLFILLGKAIHLWVSSEAQTLAILSVLGGAVAIVALVMLARLLIARDRTGAALLAAAVTAACPLFWVTAERPLSDMAGLSTALAVQVMTLEASTPAGLAAASFAAALAAGIRSQVVWLTLPLLILVMVRQIRRPSSGASAARVWQGVVLPALAFIAGALVWAVPLVILTGGPRAYWRVFSNQGTEDLTGVVMLSTTPSLRELALSLYYALIVPWGVWPFGAVVVLLAVAGSVRLMRRSPPDAVALLVAFGPYFLFDLFFQETVTSRYALPLVVPVAFLAIQAAEWFPGALECGAAAVIIAVSLVIGAPMVSAYSRAEAPAFRLLARMRASEASTRAAPVVAMHRREELDLRRTFDWDGDDAPRFQSHLPAPPKHEWLQLVDYWNGGGRSPIWFVADPLRSDLALVAHGSAQQFRWGFPEPLLVGGTRPSEMDWYSIMRPDWYLGEGWELTPETAGIAKEDHRGPGLSPIKGWIRKVPGPSALMIGGRNLTDGGPPADLAVAVDGRVVSESTVAPGFFLEFIDLPSAPPSSASDYATVTIQASPIDQRPPLHPDVAIEQFDAKPFDALLFGYGEGWHEQEYDPPTGKLWRWTSERASLIVRSPARPATLRLAGETETFSKPSHVVIRSGGQTIAEALAGPRFTMEAQLPAELFKQGSATITIETDQVYVPAERFLRRSRDRRHLGLKIEECSITPM